ncbi:MAG: hypothetical protein AAGD38_15265 [Acidobacteriota bacterium]
MIRRAFVFVAALALFPALASATPACDGSGENLMQWPENNPVWEFCWLRPDDSSGPRGSGLELRDVYYNDILVMKRAHAPMLNVEYDAGGCGCYRDWSYAENDIRADNQVSPGFFEPTFDAETVCDNSTSDSSPVGDCPWGGAGPCNEGVAANSYAERLVMTTQYQAGWYRYTMRWIFHLDGRIEPQFGFGTANTSCSAATHRHHNYWRIDFDINGAADDQVAQVGGDSPGVFSTEQDRTWANGATWEITDQTTGRGYRLVPGEQDRRLPADGYSKTDFMASLYKSTELQDNDQGIGDCDVEVEDIVDGEGINGVDVVAWYRGGVQDVVSSDMYRCKTVGPTLVPIGDWSRPPVFEDSFESGDTAAWSSTVN